jgi:8-oxo-dGTP pyrophosphatase MutT (NUDIX family)
METTRHLTATVYLVADGATALHEHPRHGTRLPPGGHVERDELPHEAGLREVREETGLDATLVGADRPESEVHATLADATGVTSLPDPHHHLLYDVTVHDDAVSHQHVDLIYYATVPQRALDPGAEESAVNAWDWYTAADLASGDFDPDVARLGTEAVETVRRAER